MKVKFSKNQWLDMGRKAGWIKTALNEDEFEVLDFSTNLHKSPTYSMRLAKDGFEFEVEGDLEFEFTPAQRGSQIDPSWPASWDYIGHNVTSFICVGSPSPDVPLTPPPYLENIVKKHIAQYLDEKGKDMANEHGSIMADDSFEPPYRDD